MTLDLFPSSHGRSQLMPSRQSTRLKRAALKYAQMTAAERERLSVSQRARFEAMSRKWRQFDASHPRGFPTSFPGISLDRGEHR